MKLYITLFLLIDFNATVFAQLNGFKEQAERDNNVRLFNIKNKVKQVDKYFMKQPGCATCPDSSLFLQYFINQDGNTYRMVRYVYSASEKKVIAQVDTVMYDVEGHISQVIYDKYSSKPRYAGYVYDKNGFLLKDSFSTHVYDERGNVIVSNEGSDLVDHYNYNDKDQLIKHWLTGDRKYNYLKKTETYSYVYHDGETVQNVQTYDFRDSLKSVKQVHYNAKGDKTKEYDVSPTGTLTLVETRTYNPMGLAESLGPVSTYFTEHQKQVQEHRLYTYDGEGNQVTMATFEKDKATGKETLISLQKFNYFKYP